MVFNGRWISAENIASELEMSKSLVRQYVEIIVDLAKMKKG
jgi:biotin operon repressor